MLFRLSIARLFGLGLFALWTQSALAQQPVKALTELDLTKTKRIERPAQELVNHAALLKALQQLNDSALVQYTRDTASRGGAAGSVNAEPKRLDKTKRLAIERPGEEVVANSAPATAVPASTKPVDATNNPTVKPGDVKWHATMAAAVEASSKSHKPVLLLHMMGQLDKQFC
jgi:hypothetical protein